MQRNLPIEDANNSESEQDNSSSADDLQRAVTKIVRKELTATATATVPIVLGPDVEDFIRKVVKEEMQSAPEKLFAAMMMKKETEVMMIRYLQKLIGGPTVEDFIQKVVKESFQSAQEKFFTCQNRNSVDDAPTSRPRTLGLKFLDEVSDSVLTGNEIKGKEGNDIKISLFDNVNGLLVKSGPEASAEVEILLLVAGPNDNVRDMSRKDFNNSIIRENDKTKPHFTRRVTANLKEGIGVLSKVKLGHGSSWTKSCKCRLGARVVDQFDGSTVKEAWTKSFIVRDSRCKHNEKHYPPNLSDDVWRLKHIGKDGALCKRLHIAKINTVQQFLFLLNVDPEKLQKVLINTHPEELRKELGKGAKKIWNATVAHARQCKIDDTQIYFYNSSSEYNTGVVFDTVGQLKGLLHNSHFLPFERVSNSEKADARKLLASAFENRKDTTSLDEIFSRNQLPPCISNATNSSGLDSLDCNFTMAEVIYGFDPTQSQDIIPSYNHNAEYTHSQGPESGSSPDLDFYLQVYGENEEGLASVAEILNVKSHSGQQTTAVRVRLGRFIKVVMSLQWLFRVRKRVMPLSHSRVQKRQRQC